MRSKPRLAGGVLFVFGLALALLLAVIQSSGSHWLGLMSIATILLIAVLAITFGLFLMIKNRGVRTDTGIR